MNKEEYPSIGEVRYTETLPNGLRLVVVPKEGVAASYAAFATEYGGAFRRFRTGQDWLDTPAGIAHYLEHKMFDMPEGNNALEILSANGADPNAFTSSGMTVYYFESTRNFQENLEESVEKEQGIIGQEIRQTEDSPGFEVYIQLMKLLYDHHPIRDAVAGTVESIREITPQVLYDCHRIFYHPSNMTLCVSGDVDPQEVRDIALKVLTPEPGTAPEPDFGPEDLAEPKEKRHSMAPSSLPPPGARNCSARSSRRDWCCGSSSAPPRISIRNSTPPDSSAGTSTVRRITPPAPPPSSWAARARIRRKSTRRS